MATLKTKQVHTILIDRDLFQLISAYVSYYQKKGEYNSDPDMTSDAIIMRHALTHWRENWDGGKAVQSIEVSEDWELYCDFLRALRKICELIPEAKDKLEGIVVPLMTKEML